MIPVLPAAIDWGDFPTWVSAITTALALIAAFTVVVIELRRDTSRRDDEKRGAQADKVAAWYEFRPHGRGAAVVLNSSALPIYHIVIQFVVVDDDGKALDRVFLSSTLLVKPGEQEFVAPPALHHTLNSDSKELRRWADVAVAISFRDAAGVRWLRREDGILKEMPRRPKGFSARY